jgi:hypothetical protein
LRHGLLVFPVVQIDVHHAHGFSVCQASWEERSRPADLSFLSGARSSKGIAFDVPSAKAIPDSKQMTPTDES